MARVVASLVFSMLVFLVVVANCESSENANKSAVSFSETQHNGGYNGAQHGNLRQSECPSACSNRCSATSHRKACMFFCMKCCAKCLCVPPGTYGNKEACPCYNDWKTQQGGPKCP